MKPAVWLAGAFLAFAPPGLAGAEPVAPRPVLLISIDGLRPDDVLDAAGRGISVPVLQKLVREGTHASGVTGLLPSFTLP